MKTDNKYRMPRAIKARLSLAIKNKVQRDDWKNAMKIADAHSGTVERWIIPYTHN